MKHRLLLFAAVLLICGRAQAGPPPGGPPFDIVDLNHDGVVSKDEADQAPCLSRDFEKLDKNGNGVLSRDELPGPPDGDRPPRGHDGPDQGEGRGPGHCPPSFEDLDANHDGVLTREEVAADPFLAREFENFDANKNGKLTKEEMPSPPPGDQPPR